MRRPIFVVLLVPFASLILANTSYGQGIGPPHEFGATRHFPHKPYLRLSPSMIGQTRQPPELASADIAWVQCPAEAEVLGAMCGYVPVPLDRQHPERAKILIYFELYVHSNSGPAESAIMANPGGPGYSTTGQRDLGLLLLGQNLDVHDILGIDDRGRGFSGTITCQELQHGTALHPLLTPKQTVLLNWETPPASTVPATLPWTLTRYVEHSATTKWTISQGRMGEKM